MPDAEAVSRRAAGEVAALVRRGGPATVALPTGETPKGMYEELVIMSGQGLDWSGVTVFSLDEYVGVPEASPLNYKDYMERHFFSKVNVPVSGRHIFDSLCASPKAECERYDRLIAEAGGFDLAVVGIGQNGHVAFNEPGERLILPCHVQELSDDTILANRAVTETEARIVGAEVPARDGFPTHAMTVGMAAILGARSILLIATGRSKTEALTSMRDGTMTTRVPASLLQLHENCTIVADAQAAGGMQI